jgi:ribose transport system permease protein
MTTATTTVPERRSLDVGDFVRDNAWTLGLFAFLLVLLAFTKFIQPSYGAAGIQNLAISVLPLGLAAVGQAIVVIAGGIDLSVASMMALTSVVAATQMRDQPTEVTILVALGVLVLGLVLGAINGGLVVLTRVPDIVVTLAMSFVWAGFALLVLNVPGGAGAGWLKDLAKGFVGIDWIPRPALVLIAIVALVWIPVRRSRLGLSIYAIGSSQLAAFRSGVSVGRTKVAAYMLTGLFSACAGLALVGTTSVGTPLPGGYTLLSVAAIVLGGVSLAGGRGGIVGPIIAVAIIALMQTDMTFLGVNPNLATVAQGAILIGVVMLGSLTQLRRSRR